LFALWPFRKSSKPFLLSGGILYATGLRTGSYNSRQVGFDLNNNARNGVFFGALFSAIGVAFCNRIPRLSERVAAVMALAGLAIYRLEAVRLRWFIPLILLQADTGATDDRIADDEYRWGPHNLFMCFQPL
jgi:hypothetical protein